MYLSEYEEGNGSNNEPAHDKEQQNSGSSTETQKIAVNPNPRANENIKHTSFDTHSEVNTKGEDAEGIGTVGTEITDGEAG